MEIKGEVKIEKEKFEKIKKTITNILNFQKKLQTNLKKETTQILEILLGGAITLEASDLHLEPEKEKVKTRLRIDGILHNLFSFPKEVYLRILSRIKLLSGIKLNITDRAQDGRFTVFLQEEPIELRVATLPSEYGETLALRLLNPKSLIEIEQLGIREDIFQIFKKQIQQPNGMIIVTGPTGSGKTTTLYAILKRIQTPAIKIITIEDPIEYHLKGISQTQVNPKKGYNFPTGLRAIVRQDPDVILIGEIRDKETAEIAIQAALTGHLVLTTLHTNDAAGTIVRLQALGEKPVNIAPAINISIGQRLARKVCKKCTRFLKASLEEIKFFKKNLSSLPKNIKIPKIDKTLKLPHPQGCPECNFTGYRKRTGIFEFFLVDEKMENFILQGPSISALRKMAKKKGMVTMREDGLIKVLKGETTLEEINRVTRQ